MAIKQYHHEVVGAIVQHWEEPSILMLQRATYDKFWPGQWYFLTEHKLNGETDHETLERGLNEETCLIGLDLTTQPLILHMTEPKYRNHHFTLTLYLAELIQPGCIILNPRENIAYAWHPIGQPLRQNQTIKGAQEQLNHLLGR